MKRIMCNLGSKVGENLPLKMFFDKLGKNVLKKVSHD